MFINSFTVTSTKFACRSLTSASCIAEVITSAKIIVEVITSTIVSVEVLNQLINYFDPRPEYIRAIIIEWSTKSSIPIARIISADIQCSLLSARRCENFDDYSQQVD
ncbi:unnamed protein product [Rotaria magnacalcarata]